MVDIEKIKDEIVECLLPLKPRKIILFGSYANDRATDDSDIDLYVVTNDDFLPRNWNEKNDIYLKFSRRLRHLRSIVPIDLIVHTKKMHDKFAQMNGSFYHEISREGLGLYE
jgi:predicted nucleotidyltransferase